MAYGTLNTLDTLAASQQTIAQYGEDRAFEAINAALAAHNEIMNDLIGGGGLVERTTDRQRRYGGADNMSMDEVDEFGRGDAQKIAAGVTLGFPLRLFDISVQWTRKYMQNGTTAELAAQFTAATDAHRKRVTREVKKAVFTPTNNTAYVDRLIDNVTLALRALVNADSQQIPLGPNGETFDGATHTHYLATASLTAANITSLIETVREHFATGTQFLYINRAQETAVRGFTSNFVAYLDARIIPGSGTTTAQGSLDKSNLYNRAIGIFDGVEVWVKPWVPANYMVTWIDTIPPLVLRERNPGSAALVLAAEDEAYPLRCRTLEAEFGVGVWTRTAAAVLQTNNGTYQTPTITD
jgi:hypothetical protein